MRVAIPARRIAVAVACETSQNETRNPSIICLALFLPTENIDIGIVQFAYNLIICSTATSAAAERRQQQ